jgi:hypothetical protein
VSEGSMKNSTGAERVCRRSAARRLLAAHGFIADEGRVEHALASRQARELALEVVRPRGGRRTPQAAARR